MSLLCTCEDGLSQNPWIWIDPWETGHLSNPPAPLTRRKWTMPNHGVPVPVPVAGLDPETASRNVWLKHHEIPLWVQNPHLQPRVKAAFDGFQKTKEALTSSNSWSMMVSTSGWALSTSSKRTTAFGHCFSFFVSCPPSSWPT